MPHAMLMAEKKKKKLKVDTPAKTPWKKEKKYGWMNDVKLLNNEGFLSPHLDNAPFEKSAPSLDAVFIASSLSQAHRYAKILNYNPKTVLCCTMEDYYMKLVMIKPDEDLIVHLCGAWTRPPIFSGAMYEFMECREWLIARGFEVEVVPEIGKP